MESISVRRRNKLRHHFTTISNVLLFGYHELADGAKVTYQVIDSFDWADSAGVRKGFAFPSLGTLARIRGVDERTIRRHLMELDRAGLVTRQERPGRPSLLIIEDPSELETFKYLRAFAGGVGEDKNVRPTPDKNVRPLLKKTEEREEKQSSLTRVNSTSTAEAGESNGERESRPVEHIGGVLAAKTRIVRNPRQKMPLEGAKREHLASEMLSVLKDRHSLGAYRLIAETVDANRIYAALSLVKQMSREGQIRKTKGALFVSMIKRQSNELAVRDHRSKGPPPSV